MRIDMNHQIVSDEVPEIHLKYHLTEENMHDLRRELTYRYEQRFGKMIRPYKVRTTLEKEDTEIHIQWEGVLAELKSSGNENPIISEENWFRDMTSSIVQEFAFSKSLSSTWDIEKDCLSIVFIREPDPFERPFRII